MAKFTEQYDNITEKKGRPPFNKDGHDRDALRKELKKNGLQLGVAMNFDDESLLWSLLDDKKKLKLAYSDIRNGIHKVIKGNHALNNRSFK